MDISVDDRRRLEGIRRLFTSNHDGEVATARHKAEVILTKYGLKFGDLDRVLAGGARSGRPNLDEVLRRAYASRDEWTKRQYQEAAAEADRRRKAEMDAKRQREAEAAAEAERQKREARERKRREAAAEAERQRQEAKAAEERRRAEQRARDEAALLAAVIRRYGSLEAAMQEMMGAPRHDTATDRRDRVIQVLREPKGAALSDREIARRTGITPKTVGNIRRRMAARRQAKAA